MFYFNRIEGKLNFNLEWDRWEIYVGMGWGGLVSEEGGRGQGCMLG